MSAPTIDPVIPAEKVHRNPIAKWIRRLAVPIILGWIALIVVLSMTVPTLEKVGEMQAVSMSPKDAPSVAAMMRVGKVFQEFDSDSSAMIVLEGQQPLGAETHAFYDDMIAKLRADKKHVQHIQDFWGDPLTSAGAQSEDGKATYVQVYLAGNMGEALGNESVTAIQKLISGLSPPPGVKVYVTGGSALQADQETAGNSSIKIIEFVTVGVIISMLLFFYRSIFTVVLVLAILMLSLSATRGVVAFLGFHNLIGLSTFATQLLVTLAIAATTDYAIFLIGRYQEARTVGEDREAAYYTMFHGTAHVVLGSGMTIAGATFCLSFTRLPYFQTLGVPLAVGMVVAVLVALTLGPAIITVASRFRLLEPKRAMRIRFWRRLGAAVVRWPGLILTLTILLALVGLLTLPGYQPSYNDRKYLPADLPANQGFAAAERHFPVARMNPEMLLVETDKDLRNSADFLVIERIAKAVTKVPGIGRVQAITRPEGKPLKFSTIPAQISMGGTSQEMNRSYMQKTMDNMLTQANAMQTTIDTMTKMSSLMGEMAAVTHSMVARTRDMTVDIAELRDHISDFDDFFRPIRNYLYWEPHCYDIPVCWSMRSVFDTLDGVDTTTDDIQALLPDLERLD
ncbi:MAG: putative drug exporter of the superfamily, partial [Mycobacterium sp.]|nr:putative drug exporter of the superfamily [Mycobacterium sp.]